jgi:putative hydrolase
LATRRNPVIDVNADVAGLLYDMAALHKGDRRAWAYKRAALTVLRLDMTVEDLAARDRLRSVPNIGPSTERIVRDYLEHGRSLLVDRAVAEKRRAAEIQDLRNLRRHFLSRAAAERVNASRLPGVMDVAQYRGDFQMHSEWSDGADTLAGMVDAAIAIGHTCAAVTDHSYGLSIARGMSMQAAGRQHEAIDRLNRANRGRFRLFKGIEVNIMADGDLDMTVAERRLMEIVVAAPHSGLRSRHDQTERLVAAVRQPGVHVLGHPRGRRFNTRAGLRADWTRVFAAAAASGTAIEIDGHPERQDLDAVLAADALAAGCLFALDSDAHATGELAYSRIAVAHARLAGIPAGRVINSWRDDRILEWAEKAWER